MCFTHAGLATAPICVFKRTRDRPHTAWFESLRDFDKVDWAAVYAATWRDTLEDGDRQRRKQAEFLVHQFCPWSVIQHVAVLNQAARKRVADVFSRTAAADSRPVVVRRGWYY
ncbi:MAG: DUF4433 domain-containing protein [Acidobacteria bacterium]|nr:DUF4433 domain-containing protein [Acidobacteriota bacterium]